MFHIKRLTKFYKIEIFINEGYFLLFQAARVRRFKYSLLFLFTRFLGFLRPHKMKFYFDIRFSILERNLTVVCEHSIDISIYATECFFLSLDERCSSTPILSISFKKYHHFLEIKVFHSFSRHRQVHYL